MEESKPVSPHVLISYAHESPSHVDAVLALYELLRECGIDAIIDRVASQQPQSWPLWIEREIRQSSFVLCVASPEYRRRVDADVAPDEGRGVQYEAALVHEAIYSNRERALRKFLPVLLPNGSAKDIPTCFGPDGGTHYQVKAFDADGIDPLLRYLTQQPEYVAPPLGDIRTWPAGKKSGVRPAGGGVPERLATPAEPPDVEIFRLPETTNSKLFGRASELAWLDRCWKEGVYVASIAAWGGAGKSALVNAWLARLRDDAWRSAEKVYGWSFSGPGTEGEASSDVFVAAALQWFGDTDATRGVAWDKGVRLAGLIRRKRTLLILDGVEPLQHDPGDKQGQLKDSALKALVKELGAQNQGLCVITSRMALSDLVALGGDKVQSIELPDLSPEAGADLLRACSANGTDAELQEATKEYRGHSFSLTLLGHYVASALKGDIRRRDRNPSLESEPANRMMATYERWLAGKPELAILGMLSLFDKGAGEGEMAVLQAKPPMAGLTEGLDGLPETAWNEAIATLRNLRLLSASHEAVVDETFDVHPLVREHFRQRLRRDHAEAWREAHRRLYEHGKSAATERPETIEELAPSTHRSPRMPRWTASRGAGGALLGPDLGHVDGLSRATARCLWDGSVGPLGLLRLAVGLPCQWAWPERRLSPR